jgi:hypothetical protein
MPTIKEIKYKEILLRKDCGITDLQHECVE